MDKLFEMIRKATQSKFCGYIQINFYMGGIGKINKMETLEVKDL